MPPPPHQFPPKLTLAQRCEKETELRKLFPEPVQPVTLPAIDHEATGARIIIVGDVHACLAELRALLAKCDYDESKDHVILLGDLVGKGPDSIGVLDEAMRLPRCITLIGNHDWTLLRWYEAQRLHDPPAPVPYSSLEGNPYPQMALEITKEHYEFIKAMPLVVRIPQHNVVCVHAGFNPLLDDPVKETNGYDCLHIRNVVDTEAITSQGDAQVATPASPTQPRFIVSEALPGEAWAQLFRGPELVLFGHDAMRKLQKHPFAIGLDTGCCYGGELTAFILPSREIVSVASKYNCLKPTA